MNNFLNQTQKIENIKKGYNSPMGGIIKYIQSGDDFLNQDFFGKETQYPITQNIIDEFINKVNLKLNEIKNFKKEILNLDLNQVEKNFLINSLNITGLKYILFKNSVYLEAEKYGFILSNEKRNILLKRINKIQDMVYGPEITSIEKEKNEILSLLQEKLYKNRDKISQSEFDYFENFINSFVFEKIELEQNKDAKKLNDIFLPKEKIIFIFETVLEIYGLNEWNISLEKVGNFSVKKEDKKIILPEEKIETTSLNRLLKLIDHEIGVHVIRGDNTNNTLKTSGEGYLEAEEGFATLSELLFDNKLNEVNILPTIHHISTFIAENCDGEKTKKLLEIYYKLTGLQEEKISKETLDRTLRIKRFVSLKEKGANRKDVSYTRGQSQVVELLKQIEDYVRFNNDFYFTKFSLDDVELSKDFKESLKIEESDLKYPLWIGKILYKKLSKEKIFLKLLKEEDVRFEAISKITFQTKRKIISILKTLKQ